MNIIPLRDPILERPLPSSPETEKAILGAIILDNTLVAQAIEMLKPSDFYVPSHRRIFTAMIGLFERGSEINPILIAEELRRDNSLDASGGVLFLTNLTYGLPHVTSITQYAKIVHGKALLRNLIRAANKITSEALDEEINPDLILNHAERAIFEVSSDTKSKGFSNVESLVDERLDRLEQLRERGESVTGVPSGFIDLDNKTLGFQSQDLIIIAARPSIGKSSYALAALRHASLRLGLPVAMFSLEMSSQSLVDRVLCAEANVDSQRFRLGYLNPEEWERLFQAREELKQAKFFIDDTPAITITQMRAKLRRLVTEHGELSLVVVDYLQLMGNNSGNGNASEYQTVSQNSMGLKTIAKEFNVPLIALSQLNRKPEDRSDRRPQLNDLRSSGGLEQDADVVILMSREDLLKKNQPDYIPNHKAELDIAKQRNGPVGSIYLRFDEITGRWENLYDDSVPF